MDIRIIRDKISLKEVEELAEEFYIEMVKGVADVERGVLARYGD